MRNKLVALDDFLHSVEKSLLVVFVFSMIILAVVQIILRNGFGFGLIWADSLVKVLVLWVALIGAMAAAKYNQHIKIDVLYRKYPTRLLPYINICLNLFICTVCFFSAYFSIQFISAEIEFPNEAFSNVPSWVCGFIIPVFFSITGTRYFFKALSPSSLSP